MDVYRGLFDPSIFVLTHQDDYQDFKNPLFLKLNISRELLIYSTNPNFISVFFLWHHLSHTGKSNEKTADKLCDVLPEVSVLPTFLQTINKNLHIFIG